MKTDLLTILETQRPTYFDDLLVAFERPDYDDITFHENATVDLSQVVGLNHCQYAGSTWGELVGDAALGLPPRLKRLDICLRHLTESPDYYLARYRKDDWIFYKAGDAYYVVDGHHRAVVGRLVLELNGFWPIVRGVRVSEVSPKNWERVQREGRKVEWDGPFTRHSAPFSSRTTVGDQG